MARTDDHSIADDEAQLTLQRLASTSKDNTGLQAKIAQLQAALDSANILNNRLTDELLAVRAELLAYQVKEGDQPAALFGFSVADFERVKMEVLVQ